MQHFTRTLFALALSLGTFTAAFAGDGTKKSPYTTDELLSVTDSLYQAKDTVVYVKGDFIGYGTNPSQPQEEPAEDYNIILSGPVYRMTLDANAMVLALLNAPQRENYVAKVHISESEGVYYYAAEEISGAFSLTVGENQLGGFGLDCNFRVENPGKLAYATVSLSEDAANDFVYHVYPVADSVITGSSMGYIFGGTPGTYDVTLTLAKGSTPEDGNVLRTGTAGETMALPGQQLFKWENVSGSAGLRLGDNGGQTVNLPHTTDVYASLEEAKVQTLLGDKADRTFLPWTEKKVTGLFAPKMRPAAARLGVYDLSGRKVADGTSTAGLPQGLYVVGGRKVFVR